MSGQQQPGLEHERWLDDRRRSFAERAHDSHDEFHRNVTDAAIATSTLALRTALLINGGAAVALLAFAGQLHDEAQRKAVAMTLPWFAWGVFAATVGIALAYLVHYCTASYAASKVKVWEHPYLQYGLHTSKWQVISVVFHVAAAIAGAAALGLFIHGMLVVRSALIA